MYCIINIYKIIFFTYFKFLPLVTSGSIEIEIFFSRTQNFGLIVLVVTQATQPVELRGCSFFIIIFKKNCTYSRYILH